MDAYNVGRKKKIKNQEESHMVKGDNGLGFGSIWFCSSTFVLYSPGSCVELPIDEVPSTANGGEESVTYGALGDGDVGGFKSSYLKHRMCKGS